MQGNGDSAVARKTVTLPLKNGKHVEFGQLLVQDFIQLREEACADYKRNLILTYTKNLDLFPEEERAAIRAMAFEKAEKVTPDSLPKVKTWVAARDPTTGAILRHHGDRFRHEPSGQWIENGAPLIEQDEVEYTGYWQSQTRVGLLHTLLRSMRRCPGQEACTLDDVIELIAGEDELLEAAANAVGDISARRLGNADAPAAQAGAAA